MTPGGEKKVLGKGQLPVIKAVDNERVICVWENEKGVEKVVVEL